MPATTLAEPPEETPEERAARHALNKGLTAAFNQLAEEARATTAHKWDQLPLYTRDDVRISLITKTEFGQRCYISYTTRPVRHWDTPREVMLRLDSTEDMPGFKRDKSILLNEVHASDDGPERLGQWHGAFHTGDMLKAIDLTIEYLNQMLIEAHIKDHIEMTRGADFSISEWLYAFEPNARDWRAEWQDLLASVQQIDMIIRTYDKQQGIPDKKQ